MPGFHHDAFILALAFFVGALSVARTVRLWTFDDFPPVAWLRLKALAKIPENSSWTALAECPFCTAPYFAAGMVGWAWISDLHWTWWVINLWWAGSYLAATYVAYDQPD